MPHIYLSGTNVYYRRFRLFTLPFQQNRRHIIIRSTSGLPPRFIADHLAISVRSLYRKMEEIGEESPTILIKECRLHAAKDLLLKTQKTIDEIVFE